MEGSARDIFSRSSEIIFEMIREIISKNPPPVQQKGEPTIFKIRKPEEGNLEHLKSVKNVYNFIRMLDAEGYPNAFLETKEFKFEFSNASLKSNNQILANVRITKK